MRPIFVFTLFVLFSTSLFAQDGWNNWKPYSSESYYDIQKERSEKVESENYDIYKPKFYVTRMQNRFLSVDRFAHKYPSLSPYQYTANNPINFIDVNGDSIWIAYQDADGNEQRLLYTQGMTYEGGNQQVASLVGSLNQLNSIQSGNTVLTTLTGSTAHYNLGLSGQYGGAYTPNAVQQGSGGNFGVANPTNVSGLAHELFHGFQHENMNMINSTAFEVGAHLFGSHIEYEMSGTATLGPVGGSQEFASAYINLLYNESFNQSDFNTATRTFLQSSYNPLNPPNYNHLRPTVINNPVISRFYPLIRLR